MHAHDSDELEDEFEVIVRRQGVRIEKGRREKDKFFWKYVGLIGTVGWSVVVPMLIGVLVGVWLDRKFDVSMWTLGLLILGLAMGCWNAWRTVTREQ